MSECGTTAGYRRHRRHDEQPCKPCTVAIRDYQRKWRAKDPTITRRSVKAYQLERTRALVALSRRHPDEYKALLKAEKAR